MKNTAPTTLRKCHLPPRLTPSTRCPHHPPCSSLSSLRGQILRLLGRFQPQAVSICASLFALDSWVLAFGPQLYPSSDLPHTAQLVPLVVKLWLGTCSGLVWRHDHCPFPACSVLWFFLFLVAVKSLARLSPLELVWLKEVVPWFLALLCDPHTF